MLMLGVGSVPEGTGWLLTSGVKAIDGNWAVLAVTLATPNINITDPDLVQPAIWKTNLALDHKLPFLDLTASAEIYYNQTYKALNTEFLNQYRDYQGQKRILAAANKPLPVDPALVALEQKYANAQKPIVIDPKLVNLRRDAGLSEQQLGDKRLTAAQDLAWALINSPAFLFNH